MQSLSFDFNAITLSSAEEKKFYAKFTDVYAEFVKNKTIDVVRTRRYDDPTARKLLKLRSEVKTYALEAKRNKKEDVCNEISEYCYNNPKTVTETATKINDKKLLKNPFKAFGYETKSDVQQRMEKNLVKMPVFGAYAYSCSCGSGKTLAGINYICNLKLQTIIISARNAVNDQWKTQLQDIYPRLIIYEDFKKTDGDVYVVTPQLIYRHLDDFPLTPGLIIYDEIHNMLATVHIQALLLPMMLVNQKRMHELPYMIGLSATYPEPSTRSYKYILKLFGRPIVCESVITKIPVYVYDYYDHYSLNLTHEARRHMNFDRNYPKLNDMEAVRDAFDRIDANTDGYYNINPIDTHYKGIVMGYTIYTSLLIARYIHDRYNCNVLLVRTENMPNVLFRKDAKYDYSVIPAMDYTKYVPEVSIEDQLKGDSEEESDEAAPPKQRKQTVKKATKISKKSVKSVKRVVVDDDSDDDSDNGAEGDENVVEEENGEDEKPAIDTSDLLKCGIGEKYDFHANGFDDIAIIVSTVQRLKEGFSVQYATWGICTKFVWNQASRVQILGRIRRSSPDEELNKQRRIMLCYGGPKPSTVNIPASRRNGIPPKWLYNDEYEKLMFAKENYIRL